MDEKIDWSERLGDALLTQQAQVMDTVQSLRLKAKQAGNLSSSAQVVVEQKADEITIEPGSDAVIHLPYQSIPKDMEVHTAVIERFA